MIRRIFLESRILYLLSLQLQQSIQTSLTQNNSIALNETMTDKLSFVKDYLDNNVFKKDITLAFLARLAGTNENTLKQGFKQLYGTSAIKYLHDLKFSKARQLLTHTDTSITDIAYKIGYKNQRHFSTAFKNQFGITPREVRKL